MRKRKGKFEILDISIFLITIAAIVMFSAYVFLMFHKAPKQNGIISLYDYNGNVIQRWGGEYRIDRTSYGVYFDIEGRRVVVHGGIIIAE